MHIQVCTYIHITAYVCKRCIFPNAAYRIHVTYNYTMFVYIYTQYMYIYIQYIYIHGERHAKKTVPRPVNGKPQECEHGPSAQSSDHRFGGRLGLSAPFKTVS